MDSDSFVTDFLTGREDPRAHSALEQLVDSLHMDRGAAISSFLSHPGSEDLLAALVGLLLSVSDRVSGNAAYALGILTETEAGFQRVYSLASKDKNNRNRIANSNTSVLENLVDLLVSKDTESVMNIAGTLGTLAETQAGRKWMLESPCIDTLIDRIANLLQSDNTWTAGNSALVLARLSISEDGCIRLLQHHNYKTILANLIDSLGSAGRGTNAAFAIGRLCDQKMEHKALENHVGLEKMVSQLYKMLISDDVRWSKNACFALSSLASKKWGQDKLLSSFHCSEILATFTRLLSSEDHETGWFSAVALHTLANLRKGCLQIRKNLSVEMAMKKVIEVNPNAELKAEVTSALEFLKRLPKPKPPKVKSISASEIQVEWDLVTSKCGFPITYKVYKDDQCVFEGKDCLEFKIGSLQSATKYRIQLQTCAEEDNSPLSDAVTAVTTEEVPSPPLNLQIVGRTVNLLKINWDPPQNSRGTIKFYHILTEIQDGTGCSRLFECTTPETSFVISGLTAGTTYNVQVLAANSKGKGLPASVLARTSAPGSHVPTKPNVTVIGRNELHVTWSAPEEPLGRINYYELSMDGIVVYSGNNMNFYIRRLMPDTEYNFAVSAVTTEGRFESKTTKKRTAKDEYETNNAKVLKATENPIAVEESKLRPRTSLSRRCRSACVPLKTCKSSSKTKNITDETTSTGKSSKTDSCPIKRTSIHSAIQRHDCSQRRIPVKYTKPGFTANSTSQERKQNGRSILMFPNYINISLRGSNRKDIDGNATPTQTVSNGRLIRTKTFIYNQSNRSSERQAEKSTNGTEAEISSSNVSTFIQDDYAFSKTANTKTTIKSINNSGSPMVHTACRMWSVPSAFRSKSAIKSQPKKSSAVITSRFSNFLFRSCRENQVRSVFNSHRWLAMENRPCLELRVPVSTPETANTNSTSSRKSSSYSDTSSTEKKQVCFEEISKPEDSQTSGGKEPLAQEEPNHETLSQSLHTLEIHEGEENYQKVSLVQDSLGGTHMSAGDADPHIISCFKSSIDCDKRYKSREITKESSEIWDHSSETDDGKKANCDKSYQCKESVDSDKESRTKIRIVEKEPGQDKNGHFLNTTSSILPFNENDQSKEKCWKTTESYSKRTKPRTVRSARNLKFSRSASASCRPGTVSISGSRHHQSAGVNQSGKANTNEDNTRFLGIRTMTLNPTLNMIGSRNNNSMFTEGFVPSQLRTQPCNLNLRQLQRIHTTLLGIRGDNDKLVIQTLLYQRNQDQQRNTTLTTELGKSATRQLIQKSATTMR